MRIGNSCLDSVGSKTALVLKECILYRYRNFGFTNPSEFEIDLLCVTDSLRDAFEEYSIYRQNVIQAIKDFNLEHARCSIFSWQ